MEYRSFSIYMDIFCIILCILGFVLLYLWRKVLTRTVKIQTAILVTHICHISANLTGLSFKGTDYPFTHTLLVCSNFLEYSTGYMLECLLTLYIIICISDESKHMNSRINIWKKVAVIYCVIQNIFLIIAQFTDLYYIIDDNNIYQRTESYFICLVFGAGMIVLNGLIFFEYRKYMDRYKRSAIIIYLCLPAAAVLIQPFVYGIYFLILADTIAIWLVFIIMMYVQSQEYSIQLRELSDMKIAVLEAQVQPHFILNTLETISDMCEDNSDAQKLLTDFSCYLRGNLNALSCTVPVTFDTELEQIQHYMNLETVRFEGKIRAVYDIQAKGFFIPVFTVQPLVENALKHGLRGKKDIGTVRISSHESETAFVIEVNDNGKGFNPDEKKSGGNAHIGIENVRRRLEIMVNGTLTIDSTIGKGTTAVILIPKKRGKNDNICG